MQIYLNTIKAGSFEDTLNGVKTKVNVEWEITSPLDDVPVTTSWNDHDRKILASLKSPNQTLKFHSYTSSPQLRDRSASSGTEKEKISES